MKYGLYFLLSLLVSACSQNTHITIRSTPEGATVSEAVKGNIGTTPLSIIFTKEDCENIEDKCTASFYFSKPGYKDRRITRYVQDSEMRVHAYLFKNKTKLSVKGYPAFAKLDIKYQNSKHQWKKLSLIDDEGNVPSLQDEQVWSGNDYCLIRIIAESPGYIPQEKNIKIKKGEHKTIEYSLAEYIVTGEILSTPSGADVYERSLGYLGRTPFKIKIPYDQLVRISAQRSHNIDDPVFLYLKLTKEGYQTVEEIKDIGVISDSDTPVQFSVPVNLIPMTHK